jgi:AbrB family looped-hinge helix DNA binding protein
MQERVSVVTRKGQITIPAEFRKALGLKEGDKVALSLEEGKVRLSPSERSESVVTRTAGVFKTDEPAKTAEELRVLAEEAIAADVMERSGGK